MEQTPSVRQQRRRWMRVVAGVTLVALLGAACGDDSDDDEADAAATTASPNDTEAPSTSAAPREMQTVRVAMPTLTSSIGFLPFFWGIEKGYYEEEGIRLEPSAVLPGPATAALISGDVEVVAAGGSPLRAAAVEDAPFVNIMMMTHQDLTYLNAKPEFPDVQSLRGATVGSGPNGSTTDLATRTILTEEGLEPGADVEVVALQGGSPGNYQALIAGQVDAAILSAPFNFSAAEAGFPEIAATTDYGVNSLQAGITVNRKFLDENPDLVEGLIRATVRATMDFLEADNREDVIALTESHFGISTASAEKTLDLFLEGVGLGAPPMTALLDTAGEGATEEQVRAATDYTILERVLTEVEGE